MGSFEMIGPVMIGPSSSHTAGATRIGLAARQALGAAPRSARIGLHGSFAATGRGHGTDRALLGGILGLGPGDVRLRTAFDHAQASGLRYAFDTVDLGPVHPNSVRIGVDSADGKRVDLVASSTGGGRAEILEIDGFRLSFRLGRPTLLVYHLDRPGVVRSVSDILASRGVNIAGMRLVRKDRGGDALMAIEADMAVPGQTIVAVGAVENVTAVRYLVDEEE